MCIYAAMQKWQSTLMEHFKVQNIVLDTLLFADIQVIFNTFKYHVSCTDGKISVRIIYIYYLFLHRRPTHK